MGTKTLAISDDLHRKIKTNASKKGISIQDYVTHLFYSQMKKEESQSEIKKINP